MAVPITTRLIVPDPALDYLFPVRATRGKLPREPQTLCAMASAECVPIFVWGVPKLVETSVRCLGSSVRRNTSQSVLRSRAFQRPVKRSKNFRYWASSVPTTTRPKKPEHQPCEMHGKHVYRHRSGETTSKRTWCSGARPASPAENGFAFPPGFPKALRVFRPEESVS